MELLSRDNWKNEIQGSAKNEIELFEKGVKRYIRGLEELEFQERLKALEDGHISNKQTLLQSILHRYRKFLSNIDGLYTELIRLNWHSKNIEEIGDHEKDYFSYTSIINSSWTITNRTFELFKELDSHRWREVFDENLNEKLDLN